SAACSRVVGGVGRDEPHSPVELPLHLAQRTIQVGTAVPEHSGTGARVLVRSRDGRVVQDQTLVRGRLAVSPDLPARLELDWYAELLEDGGEEQAVTDGGHASPCSSLLRSRVLRQRPGPCERWPPALRRHPRRGRIRASGTGHPVPCQVRR